MSTPADVAGGAGTHVARSPAAALRVGILTVSDAGARGERADGSGDAAAVWAEGRGYVVAERSLVADETTSIVARLVAWCDAGGVDLLLTTGGTGLSPRDVTPEATRAVLEREAPGIAERIRIMQIERFPRAALSRGVAGTRASTLIVNLPGSRGGVLDALAALDAIVDHACEVVRGRVGDHAGSAGSVAP